MPQMSPLSWTLLYTFVILVFLSTIIFNYFTYSLESKGSYSTLTKKFHWKW